MFPALKLGKINTLASPRSAENGYRSRCTRASTAVSACISPSTMSVGSASRASRVARATFSASGCRTEPKLENESIATRGSSPKVRTMRAAVSAICASCSAVGSTLIVVSPQNTTRLSNTSMYIPESPPALGEAPTVSSAGRTVSGYVAFTPESTASASPNASIAQPK